MLPYPDIRINSLMWDFDFTTKTLEWSKQRFVNGSITHPVGTLSCCLYTRGENSLTFLPAVGYDLFFVVMLSSDSVSIIRRKIRSGKRMTYSLTKCVSPDSTYVRIF